MPRSILRRGALAGATAVLAGPTAGPVLATPAAAAPSSPTATPIRHLVVVIGENHTFDNVFATYQPPPGQHVWNLASKGIVTNEGSPGPKAAEARQDTATDTATHPGHYTIDPTKTGVYRRFPRPNTTSINPACDGGQPKNSPDTRFPADLPNSPYQITRYVPYNQPHASTSCQPGAYVGDPIHRFYQMWQEVNKGSNHLFTWVHQTSGDSNGVQPPPIHQGAVDMGYYNMAAGDAPAFRFMARHFAMSDNYHQAIMGGTGANHVALGDGAEPVYRNSAGRLAPPPANQVENPHPYPGSNNAYTNDGFKGGSYSNCSDLSQPGVASIRRYLAHLSYRTFRNGDCQHGAWYLLNNYKPGYLANGQPARLGPHQYTVPPQTFPTIGDQLSAHHVSWGYFGQGFNHGHPTSTYCNICNPFQYATSIMANPAKRAHLQGLHQFRADVRGGKLPAVSFVKPDSTYDGHPASSTLAAFGGFASRVVNAIMAKPKLFAHTAILVTFDEGGGYYDSGYVQPIDFFGDGTRVPMLAISPWTIPGAVDHTYTDHESVLKFIEANWHLPPLSPTSRDNLPNPVPTPGNPYVPRNRPAIGNLMGLFNFHRPQHASSLVPRP